MPLSNHEIYMKKAIELAKKAYVSPNPRVGSLIVKDNCIIAEGYHQQYGGPHAEVQAFRNLPPNVSLENATLYVSLEPCSHHGKTPPCVDLIIKSGIKLVIVACLDPNPLVAGKGVKILQDHGIEVMVGVLEDEAKELNEYFFKYITTKKPFVLLKGAMTLDGKIATVTGESRWISSEESRKEVHQLRSQMTAIMVGINTVLVDDPMLDSRIENGRNPTRIILDSHLKTPITSKIVQTSKDIKTIIVTQNADKKKQELYLENGVEVLSLKEKQGKIDLQELMRVLGNKNIDSILLEGGATVFYSALQEKIVDKVQLYIAPKIFGGSNAKGLVGGDGVEHIEDAIQLSSYKIRQIGVDFVVEGYIK